MKAILAAISLLLALTPPGLAKPSQAAPLWVAAYYPVWEQTGPLPPDKIDFGAITELIHFAIVPRPDSSIDAHPAAAYSAITRSESRAVITRAHATGVKVLVCLGGADSGPVIRPALAAPIRGTLIKNLIAFLSSRGYDGLDVDMEPIQPADEADFLALIQALRAKMKAVNPHWLLTIPASGAPGDQPRLCALLQHDFDQINIQTYDQSGPWGGYKTWYNGSLYGSGSALMTGTQPYPSAEEKVQLYEAAGISARKLGIGIAFYGDVWTGATGPRQSITGVTTQPLAYRDIMKQYDLPGRYHWDPQAQAPYLSIAASDPQGPKFISYDDAHLCAAKVRYARTHGLGGVIIWEIGGDYRPHQPPGQRNVLLSAVKRAAHQ